MPSHPIIFSGNLVYANGKAVAGQQQATLLAYVDGLKAAGAQRIDLNPGVTSLSNQAVMSLYDAVVQHIRQLGLRLAINPEFTPGELGQGITFQDFQNAAQQSYMQLASRYQPDNFVIVHEPTTAATSMGVATTVQDWHNFILALAPVIKKASPHTRVGAGGFQNGVLPNLSAQENSYFQDFVNNIPVCSASTVSTGCLDFMTMDIYNTDTFPAYKQWILLAQEAHKGIYIEETWTPHYLPSGTVITGNLTKPLDSLAILGAGDSAFASLNAQWLQAMAGWASANGMEAMTAFTTVAFFAYGSPGQDKILNTAYDFGENSAVTNAIQQGQLTDTVTASNGYLADVPQFGIKQVTSVSSASYATLTSIFNPTCGPGAKPCNANATVAPDELVSGFGVDLATSSDVTKSVNFPTTLAGTTMTLVDSSNTSYNVPMYSASPLQVNYYVPGNAKPGPATITVTSGDGAQTTGIVLIAPVAPGLYTANANGMGAASAIAVCAGTCSGWPTAGSSNGQFFQDTFTCTGNCVPQPISLGAPTDTVVVELFGTGLRHVSSTSAITATVNNGQITLPVLYAGPQSGFTGLDQVNVQIPRSLAGSGEVNLVLTVQDNVNSINTAFNTVTLNIQ
jgi:uncharacterized protein (TIGR03437 family)